MFHGAAKITLLSPAEGFVFFDFRYAGVAEGRATMPRCRYACYIVIDCRFFSCAAYAINLVTITWIRHRE